MDIFLWIMPMPPSLAMAIAIRYSVTVSMAEDITGIFRRIFFVSWVCRSMSAGSTSLSAGTSSTSSNVRPCLVNLLAASELTIHKQLLFLQYSTLTIEFIVPRKAVFCQSFSRTHFLQKAIASLTLFLASNRPAALDTKNGLNVLYRQKSSAFPAMI